MVVVHFEDVVDFLLSVKEVAAPLSPGIRCGFL
jgi:hypothetical protein